MNGRQIEIAIEVRNRRLESNASMIQQKCIEFVMDFEGFMLIRGKEPT